MIDSAISLADEMELGLVSIHLDEARAALSSATNDIPSRSHRSAITALINFLTSGGGGEAEIVQLRKKDSLEQLLSEHEALDARRVALLELTRQAPNAAEAARQLMEFKTLILQHRLTERRCVYGPLQRRREAAGVPLEKRINQLIEEMDGDWGRYLDGWDEARIEERWGEFVFATTDALLRAGDRMRLEERVIYPLAFMTGSVELRTPAR
ncbi:hypothetical protein ACU5AX_15155 [Sphingomonas sp. XXL09]|uniref:hypothetical protein n=1 Tax=Sphingomonas sp. XXL09 TaxID=3457787 RepID=UPI00406BA328